MKTRDTSAHKIMHSGGPITSGLKNGDASPPDPEHDDQKHFPQRHSHSSKYEPETIDKERDQDADDMMKPPF